MQNFAIDCSSGTERPSATAKAVGKHNGQKVEGSCNTWQRSRYGRLLQLHYV